jgi:hypothetical protein
MDNALKAFCRNPDGSWSCIAPVTVMHPKGRMEVATGRTFAAGENFMGVDLAAWLNEIHEPLQQSPR